MKFYALNKFLCAPVIEPIGGGAGGAAIPSVTVNARADVSLVEKSFVAGKSGSDYEGQLVRFILNLFDNNKGLIPDQFLSQMEVFNANDVRTFKKKRTRKDGEDPRSELRGYIRSIIKNIQPARGARHIIAHLRLMVRVRSHTKLYVII